MKGKLSPHSSGRKILNWVVPSCSTLQTYAFRISVPGMYCELTNCLTSSKNRRVAIRELRGEWVHCWRWVMVSVGGGSERLSSHLLLIILWPSTTHSPPHLFFLATKKWKDFASHFFFTFSFHVKQSFTRENKAMYHACVVNVSAYNAAFTGSLHSV